MRCYAFGLCTNLSCGLALVTYRQIKRWHTVPSDLVGPQACVEPVSIWWADRTSRPMGGRQVLEHVGIWQADRNSRPVGGPLVPPAVFQPICSLALATRLAPMPFPRPPALAAAGFFFHGIFFLRIFLPTAFFSALAKPAPIPIYFFLPGKKIALTKIVMVQGFEHQTPWFRRSFPYHYNTLMFVTDAKILLLSNNIRLEKYITHHLHTYCMNLSQLKRLKSGHRFGATF